MSDTNLGTGPSADPATGHPGDDERRTIKGGHLVVGLILLGIAGIWALDASGTVDWGHTKYAFPIVLVAAGLLGLVATLVTGGRNRRASRPGPVTSGAASTPDHGTEDDR